MTFVKARLLLEKARSGERLEIRLAGDEPVRNVPRALTEAGAEILSLAPDGAAWRLIARKAAGA